MSGLLLDDTSFWDVVWWMIMVYFLFLIIWMFVSVFADIFRRHDMNGFVKAAWVIAIFIIPFLGIILYLCFRPREKALQATAASSTAEIAQAQQLLTAGAITQAEFDTIKARALG